MFWAILATKNLHNPSQVTDVSSWHLHMIVRVATEDFYDLFSNLFDKSLWKIRILIQPPPPGPSVAPALPYPPRPRALPQFPPALLYRPLAPSSITLSLLPIPLLRLPLP